MRSPIIRTPDLSQGHPTGGMEGEARTLVRSAPSAAGGRANAPASLRSLQDQFDSDGLFAKIRALRRQARDQGEPTLLVGASMVFGMFALIPFIAAMLP